MCSNRYVLYGIYNKCFLIKRSLSSFWHFILPSVHGMRVQLYLQKKKSKPCKIVLYINKKHRDIYNSFAWSTEQSDSSSTQFWSIDPSYHLPHPTHQWSNISSLVMPCPHQFVEYLSLCISCILWNGVGVDDVIKLSSIVLSYDVYKTITLSTRCLVRLGDFVFMMLIAWINTFPPNSYGLEWKNKLNFHLNPSQYVWIGGH